MSRTRRRFSVDEKVGALRRHLLDHDAVSNLCDEYGIAPTVFYRWQKALFENAAAALERDSGAETRRLEQENAALRAKLAHKDEVIAEIMESHVELKKKLGRR